MEAKIKKVKIIRQSELTSECWLIQMWGIDKCETREALNTPECGGKRIRQAILASEYPQDGLPDQSHVKEVKE